MTTSKNKKLSGQAGDGRTAKKDARKTEDNLVDSDLENIAAGSPAAFMEKIDVNVEGLPAPSTFDGKLV